MSNTIPKTRSLQMGKSVRKFYVENKHLISESVFKHMDVFQIGYSFQVITATQLEK